MSVRIMPISDLRRRTRDVIEATQQEDDVVYITHHGRPAAVLINYERYEALMSHLEDLSDIASLQNAADEPSRPYDEFLAERKKAGRDRA
jgi:prevent-host-death family protein